MALSKKITEAVKDAQKQAEATVADVRAQFDRQFDGKLPEVHVDPTPFYAVVGAAEVALDTVKAAGEQLEAARKQAQGLDLRAGAKKETDVLQKDLMQRIADLQGRTAELQKLAAKYAERFFAEAQELPAHVLNQGLVLASNAKDQYDAAAVRGEKVVTDLRAQSEKAAFDAVERSNALVSRGRRVAKTAATEGTKVAKGVVGVVSDDAKQVSDQVAESAAAMEAAAAPVPVKRTAAHEKAVRSSAAKKAAATRKANDAEATATRKTAARSAAAKKAPAKKAPAKKAAAKKTDD